MVGGKHITYTWISCSTISFCAYHNSKTNFIPQPREQKSGRRHTKYSNTQCGCLCNKSSWYCPMEPFQMRFFVVLVICVPTTLAKQILFLNHMNRKVVGGTHNIILHYYVHISAPGLFGVVLCNCFKWDILWLISGQKSCFVCVQQQWNSGTNFFPQPQLQKSGRRQRQYSSRLCECLCTWPGRCCCMETFHMRYFVFISCKKIMLFFVCLP